MSVPNRPVVVEFAERAFGLLQALYPRGFLGEFNKQMAQAFSELARAEYSRDGSSAVAVLLIRSVVDTMRYAAVEHAKAHRNRRRRRRRVDGPNKRGAGFGELVGSIFTDLRYAVRTLAKRRGFAAAAVVTLGLGIGANTAIFSVVNGVLWRPLPYDDGGNLVTLQQQSPAAGTQNFSVQEVFDYRAQSQALEGVVEYHSLWFSLIGRGDPERVLSGVVSWQFFDLMGVAPLVGRSFLPEDDELSAPPVLMLSHEYWHRSFGGDSSVVGQTVRMNDKVYTIVGVLPLVPQYPRENDVYMPTVSCPFRSSPGWIGNRNARALQVFSRVKTGVPEEKLATDLAGVASRLRSEYPESYQQYTEGHTIVSTPLQEQLTRQARPTLLILLGTVGIVLLIACANVANLMLSSLVRREREMAVRVALGAGTGRIARQLITEATVLALMGGALGLIIAAAGIDLLVTFAERFSPRAAEISIDGSVLVFTLLISLSTGVIFGSLPAITSRSDLGVSLREAGNRGGTEAGGRRFRSALVVSQLALSFMLLIGAGLMVRSMLKMQAVRPGFDAENVITMSLAAPFTKDFETFPEFYRGLLERAENFPGVQSAGFGTSVPLSQSTPFANGFEIEGRPLSDGDLAPLADISRVTTRYFETIRQPLVRGRMFEDGDATGDARPVVLVNASLANRHFDGDAVGQRIKARNGRTWFEIVGVVGDVHRRGLDQDVADEIYYTLLNNPARNTSLFVRTNGSALALADQVRQAIRGLDPEVPVADVLTLEEVRRESLASPRLTTTLLGLFAALALVITAAGIAGVIGFSVSQRTNEIGIRMALGAAAGTVLGMIFRQGMGLVLAGLGVGVLGALALGRFMSGMLFGVGATDLVTYVAVGVVLAGVAALATLIPARRATTVDPIASLRSD
jgi:predicted permease